MERDIKRARELLERALEALDFDRGIDADDLMEEIRAYLAQSEVKREVLSKEEFLKQWSVAFQYGHVDKATFIYGVRFAEKHHGIGGGDE